MSEDITEINIVVNEQCYLSVKTTALYDLLIHEENDNSSIVIQLSPETNIYMGNALSVAIDADSDMIKSIIDNGVLSVYLKKGDMAKEIYSGYLIAEDSVLQMIENTSLDVIQGSEYYCMPFSGNGIYTVFYF